MKIKNEFILHHEGDRLWIISDKFQDFEPLTINEMDAVLFEQLKNGISSKEQLLNAVLGRFDISTVLALSEIDLFLKELKENEMLEA